ncbi:MAG: oxidoreductase domain protein [Paenibacillus sp.]|jgi:predicted dehydrogenase|nr:oxidoreductase domain protein [Paenibacillus sp.]
MIKKKYAIVGAGGRAKMMFARPLVTELKDFAELVGICDTNLHRANLMNDECGGNIPVFSDFDEMIASSKPDAVIITTPDGIHHEYIIRTLEAGCDAISEKPMTVDAEKCRAILAAEQRTGKKVTVTFNRRFIPYVSRLKELLDSGAIGKIHSVHLEWFLDRKHGADYFRRWHRRMENSGGLLIHKATHHFDMINWLIDDEPEQLYAFGDLRFYGPNREQRGERCFTCMHKQSCELYFDITASEFTKQLYFDGESFDGYVRDRCVFGEDINIYDTMSLNVKYARGTYLSYSLTAYNPKEGWKASFIGSDGRIEAQESRSVESNEIHIYDRKGALSTVQVPRATGAHGGGDQRLRRMIFAGDVDDTLGQQAGSWAGAMSLMIGAAANVSISEGKKVVISELLGVRKESAVDGAS